MSTSTFTQEQLLTEEWLVWYSEGTIGGDSSTVMPFLHIDTYLVTRLIIGYFHKFSWNYCLIRNFCNGLIMSRYQIMKYEIWTEKAMITAV